MRFSSFLFGLLVLFSLVFSQPDSLNLTLVAEWQPEDTNENLHDFDVSNGYLYITSDASPWFIDRKIYTIDVHDPSSPMEVNEFVEDSLGGVISISDSFLYTHYGRNSELAILNISQPASPFVEYIGDVVSEIRKLVSYSDSTGRYLVCLNLNEDTVWHLNVSDPSSPIRTGWYDTPHGDWEWYRFYDIFLKYPNLFILGTGNWLYPPSSGVCLRVKKWLLYSLVGTPLQWYSHHEDDMYTGAAVGDSIIYFYHDPNIILRYDESIIESVCTYGSDYELPQYASGDTFYIRTGSSTITVLKIYSDCEIETLGYYNIMDPISTMIAKEGHIFVRCGNKIYILSWLPEQIDGQGYLQQKNDYRIYPSPVIYNTQLVLNRPTDKKFGIYDISGKLLKNIPKNRTRISTENFSPGLYFLISDDKKVKIKFIVLE